MFPVIVPRDRALGDDLVFVEHVRDELHRLDGTLGVQGDGLVVGFDQLAAVAPDHVHHIVIGVGIQAQTHAKAGELRRLLQLLADLDELIPRLGGIDFGRFEDIQAGDQRPGTDGLRNAVGLALDA